MRSGSSPADPVADLDHIEGQSRTTLDARNGAREMALAESRKIIRLSANTIRSLHRGELDAARALLDEASDLMAALLEGLVDHHDLQHAGFTIDAQKEFSEATLTFALVEDAPLPSPSDLGVDVVPFLHGLGETVGEMRRRLLDQLREGALDEAERLLGEMNQIVDLLASLDYPDGMTAGLRRTTDVSRSLVERSRADLTATVVQERLRAELAGRLDD